jgi:hypothetical protein
MHQFKSIDILANEENIERYAKRYLEIMSAGITEKDFEQLSQGIDFNTEGLKQAVQKLSISQERNTAQAFRDIYRSDLGELLMTHFFEDGIHHFMPNENAFIIPLKNLQDREREDMPGRGVDAIGYKNSETGKITLLLGEAKVSDEGRNPPQVVHSSDDSIYKTQKKFKDDSEELARRLLKYTQKLEGADKEKLFKFLPLW